MKNKKLLSVLMIVGAAATLASCGSTPASSETPAPATSEAPVVEAAKIEKTYVLGVNSANSYGGVNTDVYHLNLMSDTTYELIKSSFTYGYNMNLGTTTVETFGEIVKGASLDGYTTYTLKDSERVILNSYSKMGGFNISIDTDYATYPVEMPAKTQGEKNMAQSKADVVNEYGKEFNIYVNDENNTFELSDPNAE